MGRSFLSVKLAFAFGIFVAVLVTVHGHVTAGTVEQPVPAVEAPPAVSGMDLSAEGAADVVAETANVAGEPAAEVDTANMAGEPAVEVDTTTTTAAAAPSPESTVCLWRGCPATLTHPFLRTTAAQTAHPRTRPVSST